jgi:uncharacterized membrane protein
MRGVFIMSIITRRLRSEKEQDKNICNQIRNLLNEYPVDFANFLLYNYNEIELLNVLRSLTEKEIQFIANISNGANTKYLNKLFSVDHIDYLHVIANYNYNFITYLCDRESLALIRKISAKRVNDFLSHQYSIDQIYKFITISPDYLLKLNIDDINNNNIIEFHKNSEEFEKYFMRYIIKYGNNIDSMINIARYLSMNSVIDNGNLEIIKLMLTIIPAVSYFNNTSIDEYVNQARKIFFCCVVNYKCNKYKLKYGKYIIKDISQLNEAVQISGVTSAEEYFNHCKTNGKLENSFKDEDVSIKSITIKVPNYYSKIIVKLPIVKDKIGMIRFITNKEGSVSFENYKDINLELNKGLWVPAICEMIEKRGSARFPVIAAPQLNKLFNVSPECMHEILTYKQKFKKNIYVGRNIFENHISIKNDKLYLTRIKKLTKPHENDSYTIRRHIPSYETTENEIGGCLAYMIRLLDENLLHVDYVNYDNICEMLFDGRELKDKCALTKEKDVTICGYDQNTIFAYTMN